MFPWLPPPGVPLKVLKNIRVELLEGMYANSAQTSPALSERSLLVEFSRKDVAEYEVSHYRNHPRP